MNLVQKLRDLILKLILILCYLLKSDFHICQEPPVKQPAEEKIQTGKKKNKINWMRHVGINLLLK